MLRVHLLFTTARLGWIGVLVCWLLSDPTARAAMQVGVWDRFEAVVPNTHTYADPLRDVTLAVQYTRPNGSVISFWGFYDGGTTWRIRFMPDALGTWKYTASFSDGAPGLSGTFE